MGRFAIVAVLLLVTVNPPAKPNQPTSATNESTNSQAQAPAPTMRNETRTAETSVPSPWYKRPEWWLAIFGFPTLVFLILQTLVARRAAEAALLSAQAVINAERAWLLVERGESKDRVGVPLLSYPRSAAEQPPSSCTFWMKNYGKTPAKVVAYRAELQIGESKDHPPDVASQVGYDSFNSYMFPQGDSYPFECRLQRPLLSEEHTLLHAKSPTKYLWFCGFVRYRDVFETTQSGKSKIVEHETRFCYRHIFNTNEGYEWQKAGPPERNKAT